MGYPEDLNDRIRDAHDNSTAKGFWNVGHWDAGAVLHAVCDPKNEIGAHIVAAKLALIHSEISEALEAVRLADHKQLEEELADVVIRVFDLSRACSLNLNQAITDKMEANRERPHKHGKLL